MADYGDIIASDDSDAGDELEENAEDMRRYWCEPLYYPMRIGQVLDQRYRVEHKLGHGGFSTVWMAYDSKTQTDVALKILGVTVSETNTEIAMHREIRQRVTDTSRILLSQHTFSLSGPIGTHKVLVFPLQGPNLQRCFFSMTLASRMSIAEQVLKALKSLHDGNIVHRDLSDKNIICGMQPISHINTTSKYQSFGRPRKTLVEPHTNWIGEIVLPMQVPANLLTGSVYLSDFGISIRAGTQVECKQQTPGCWCALEQFHNVNPTTASDMWSFMCIFAKLYLGALPWPPYGDPLAEIVKIFGSLPQRWSGHFYYPQRANPLWYDPRTKPETSLDALIARARPDVDSTERSYVAHVLRRGFAYEPDERITACQLLQDPDFQNTLRRYVN